MSLNRQLKSVVGWMKIIRKTGWLAFEDRSGPVSRGVPGALLPFPQPGPGDIKLNVGGGKGHPSFPGWGIVDLRDRQADVALDISRERLPFTDGSVSVIFTSHTLEHIYPQCLGFVLGEFRRVLKPGSGLLRVLVPDIRKAIRAYVEKDYGFFARSTNLAA